MKRASLILWLAVAACVLPAVGGCADLQATKYQGQAIDVAAAQWGRYEKAVALPLTAKDDMESMSQIIVCYASQATANPFAYWFDANKTILCTTTIYGDLQSMATGVQQFVKRWDATSLPRQIDYFASTAAWIADVKRYKDGTKRSP